MHFQFTRFYDAHSHVFFCIVMQRDTIYTPTWLSSRLFSNEIQNAGGFCLLSDIVIITWFRENEDRSPHLDTQCNSLSMQNALFV